MRWLDSTTDSMSIHLDKFQETVEDRGARLCCSPWGDNQLDMTQQLNNNKSSIEIIMFLETSARILHGRHFSLTSLLPDVPLGQSLLLLRVSFVKQLSAVRKSRTSNYYVNPGASSRDFGQIISVPHKQLSNLDFQFFFQGYNTYPISSVSSATILEQNSNYSKNGPSILSKDNCLFTMNNIIFFTLYDTVL